MKKIAVLIPMVCAALTAVLLTAPQSYARKPANDVMHEMEHHHDGHEMHEAKTPQQIKAMRLLEKANALCDAGKYEDSLFVYSEAIDQEPLLAEAYFRRGFALYRLGDNLGALEDLSKAIEIKSDYADAYFYRGVVWFSNGNEEKMAADLKTAARLAAVDHTAHTHVLK